MIGVRRTLRVYADTSRTVQWPFSGWEIPWPGYATSHFEKIAGYEGVNSLRGYRSPKIYSPREVVKS
jgi:hypothetical protein